MTPARTVDRDLVNAVLKCFELPAEVGRDDEVICAEFCKSDIIARDSCARLADLFPALSAFYAPCKARMYLDRDVLDEYRAVTILKQVLRGHPLRLTSRERNVRGKKVTFHALHKERDRDGEREHPSDSNSTRMASSPIVAPCAGGVLLSGCSLTKRVGKVVIQN